MLDFFWKLCGFGGGVQGGVEQEQETKDVVDTAKAEYIYPNLFEEADEMLQNALLIYTVTDLRTMAKENKLKNNPERILDMPLSLDTALGMIQDNFELIQENIGDSEHEMAVSALKSIQERYKKHTASNSQRWGNPWADNGIKSPYITKYGDDKPDTELVYAVGVDPTRRRVTVAFRGSVTPSDFVCDACIAFSKRDNPLKDIQGQEGKFRIHDGFDRYLLKHKLGGSSKYDEILDHVKELFQDKERRENYKLYCTGHSLGGALATLFSLEVAVHLSKEGGDSSIPTPVTCVSVASPRVGDISFQKVSRHLEENGILRHLRIANAGDPVTIMPKSSSKKLLAMLSPITYVTFKLKDQDFAERETYRHTGIKLKLNNPEKKKGSPLYELSYSGVTSAKEELEKDDEDAEEANAKLKKDKKGWSLLSSVKDVPNVSFHFGSEYSERMVKVKEELSPMTLNEMYATLAKV